MGATDISGATQPVHARSPQDIQGDTAQRVNQRQRGPQVGQQQNLFQKAGGALKGAAGDVAGAAEGAGRQLKGEAEALTPFGVGQLAEKNPIDWTQEFQRDASHVWGYARHSYQALAGHYHDGVHGIYTGTDARSRLLQQVLNTGTELNPLTAIPLAFHQVVGPDASLGDIFDPSKTKLHAQEEAAKRGQLPQEQATRAQQQQKELEQGAQDLPGATATAAQFAIPGTALGKAAWVGIPLMQELLGSTHPDDANAALAWAAVGGVLSFAHLPEPVRKVMEERFGDWGGFQKMLQDRVERKLIADRNNADPEKRNQAVTDWLQETINRGAMPEALTKTVARAAEEGAPRKVTAEITKEGAIKIGTEVQKGLRKLLNRIGVEGVDDLVEKVSQSPEGISDPKVISAIAAHWKDLGLQYDLRYWHPEEMPLRDPRRHMEDLGHSKESLQHVAATTHYIDQIHRGLFANHSNPMAAVLRALAGHSRATNLTHQQYMASMVGLLGEKGLNKERQELLTRAVEGDQAVYDGLNPEEKMVVDGWGLIRAASREEAKDTGHAQDFVPNWMPRTDKAVEDMLRGRGRPSRVGVLAREAQQHREISLQMGPEGRLVLGQRFKTVQEANQALAAARSQLVGQLTEPLRPLSAELRNDPMARAIHDLASSDPAAAAEQAKTLAAQKYADKETNFLLNVNRVMHNQVRSIHTEQALGEFTRMFTGDGKVAAIKLRPGDTRQLEEFRRQGYQHLGEDTRFRNYVFHPALTKDLQRYVNHVSKGLRDKDGWRTALRLEGMAVAGIMLSPMVHGLNMAGRMGMAALENPIQMASYLKNGRALWAHQWDDESWALRSEAYNSGLIPHYQGTTYADNLLSKMQDALADTEDQLPNAMRSDTRANRMREFVDPAVRAHRTVNNHFWGKVNDFGVMMYHLEKTSALRNGLEESAAREYAARRANSWMGSVAPEDTNPMLHDLSRLVLFAPNWWRTWGELMVPLYKRAGFTADPAFRKFAAYQAGKTMMAALAFQKLSGNAFNFALSGHLQNQNQPGSNDKLEISNPAVLGALNASHILPSTVDPNTGLDARTGARYTMENPFARQTQATERAMGLESGQKDWQPSDLSDGMGLFLTGRVSPLLNSVFGAGNVDLYQSAHDHQLRAVNPEQPAGSLSPANLLYGTLMMAPGGQQFAQQVNQQNQQGATAPTPVESVLGTRVPRSLQEVVGDVKDPAGRTLFSWLTGTNPAYETSQRTRGQKPSDQDYQRVKTINEQYHQEMSTLSAETLAGQRTPRQWLQAYQELSRAHAAQMEALFKGSPEYANGSAGLTAQWEGLYQRATKSDGTLDYDELARLQNQFRQDKTPTQLQQVDAALHQADTKYPMLALYHKSQNAFRDWQSQYAQQNNLDVNQLRKETGEYSALFGDTKGQRHYLTQHPELRRYQRAKHEQWDRTPMGLTHALFYGMNATVMRALRARHLTASQLAAEEVGAS